MKRNSMQEHTPEPWEVAEESDNGRWIVDPSGDAVAITEEPHKVHIACGLFDLTSTWEDQRSLKEWACFDVDTLAEATAIKDRALSRDLSLWETTRP